LKLVHFAFATLSLLLPATAFAATEETTLTTGTPLTDGATSVQTVATPPKPVSAAPLAPAEDQAVAEMLRELISNNLNSHTVREQDRAIVQTFYQNRGFVPLWIGRNVPLPRANEAMTYLRGVGTEGLDPADYPVPTFSDLSPARLAADELRLTSSLVTFARHASIGRVAFSRVSGSVHFAQKFDAADALEKLAAAESIGITLAAFNPQHAPYKALKAELGAAKTNREVHKDRINTIIANMERWRWSPHELGRSYVLVNVPDYTLKVVHDGTTAWTTRIVVGKPGEYATPLLTETIKYITINPTWNVPPSIIRNEYLPALARDPAALARAGLQMGRNKDGSIRIFQPPGERNALGRVRFNFPNRFLVYQHDTPQKHLFAKATRAYSHGCMRVQYPDQYAEVLLSISQPDDGYTAKRISAMYGRGERTIHLKTPIPVYITYQTAFIDDAGKLQMRPDIYGLDKAIATILQKSPGIADAPMARNYNGSSKPVTTAQSRERTGRLPRSANSELFSSTNSTSWSLRTPPVFDRFRSW
jgi:murein L,D-transpeptidase YcbB/YkuD